MLASFRNLILYLQTSEDPVLGEASFQGFWDWSKWSWCEHPGSKAGLHLGQPGQCGPGHVQVSHDGAAPHPRLRLACLRRPPPEGWSCSGGVGHGVVKPTPTFEHLVYCPHVLWCLIELRKYESDEQCIINLYIFVVWNALSWQWERLLLGLKIKAGCFWAFVALLQAPAVEHRDSTGSLQSLKRSQAPFLIKDDW